MSGDRSPTRGDGSTGPSGTRHPEAPEREPHGASDDLDPLGDNDGTPAMRTLRIVSVNDVYSLENLPRLRSLVDHYRAKFPGGPLLVTLAGDFLAPSLLSSLDAGRGMVDCLNAVGVTHVVLGNHEDDLEPEELWSRLRELKAICLGTNVTIAATTKTTAELARHDVIDVGDGVKVGLVGVVMADPAVYRGKPFGGADVSPANEAALNEARKLQEDGCSVVIALTHQSLSDDRALAEQRGDLRLPLIVGGHEHTPVLLDVNGTWIVKAGSEASSAVITELTWSSTGDPPTVTTRLEDVTQWPEDAGVRARVDMHMARVRELSSATLLKIKGEPLSSVGTRSRQTSMGTLICTRLRDALGADCCLFNGGGIRGSRTYTERLTYGDIEAEVPFDNEVVVVSMKGRVIRDAVAASRAKAPVESGGFLQVDDRMVVEGTEVVAIDGAPIDLEREYSVALVRELLLGLDRVEPLVRWAEENPKLVPPADSGREPKVLLVQSFAVELWRELGGFDALDADGDNKITASEIAAAIMQTRPSQAPSPVLAELVVRAVDADADRVISREDAEALRVAEERRRTKVEEPI